MNLYGNFCVQLASALDCEFRILAPRVLVCAGRVLKFPALYAFQMRWLMSLPLGRKRWKNIEFIEYYVRILSASDGLRVKSLALRTLVCAGSWAQVSGRFEPSKCAGL